MGQCLSIHFLTLTIQPKPPCSLCNPHMLGSVVHGHPLFCSMHASNWSTFAYDGDTFVVTLCSSGHMMTGTSSGLKLAIFSNVSLRGEGHRCQESHYICPARCLSQFSMPHKTYRQPKVLFVQRALFAHLDIIRHCLFSSDSMM